MRKRKSVQRNEYLMLEWNIGILLLPRDFSEKELRSAQMVQFHAGKQEVGVVTSWLGGRQSSNHKGTDEGETGLSGRVDKASRVLPPERDSWVCCFLLAIYSLPQFPHFKAGNNSSVLLTVLNKNSSKVFTTVPDT